MKSLKTISPLPLALFFLSFTLTGCYEDFINIHMEFTPGEFNQTKTEIELWNRNLISGQDQPVSVLSTADEYPPDLFWKDEETVWIITGKEGKLLNMASGDLIAQQEEMEMDQMMDYQNSLVGVDKMNYEIFSEETVDLLKNLLQSRLENR